MEKTSGDAGEGEVLVFGRIQLKLFATRLKLRLLTPFRAYQGARVELLEDFARTWRLFSLAQALSYQKSIARHRQTYLGGLWMPLSFALFAGGVSLLWSGLFNRPFAVYLPFVTYGLFVWNILLGTLTDGARALHENRNLILQTSTPTMLYPLVAMLKQTIIALYSLPFVIAVMIFSWTGFSPTMWMAIPGLILIWLFGLGVCVSLSILCAYVPDLSEFIGSGLRFVFFFTPILWFPESRSELHDVWIWNPFFHLVEVFRGPLIGTSGLGFHFAVTSGLTLTAWIFAALIYRYFAGAVSTRLTT